MNSILKSIMTFALIGSVFSVQAAPANVFVLNEGWKSRLYNHWTQDSYYATHAPNGLVGCTAVAGAAVLQYLNASPNLTNEDGSVKEKTYLVYGESTTSTISAGNYDWSILNTEDFLYAAKGANDDQKALVANVSFDVGACSGMAYRDGVSVAQPLALKNALLNDFKFNAAHYLVGPLHENLVYNQLRTGTPVILAAYGDSGSIGHTYTAVGYGETAEGEPQGYVFAGYAGSSDGWWSLPRGTVNGGTMTWLLDGVTGFAYDDDKYVALVGKVLDADGNAVVGATVTVTSGEETIETLTTGDYGQYAARVSAGKTTYTLTVSGDGLTDYEPRTVSLAHTKFPDKVDFTPGEVPVPLTVYTDFAAAVAAAGTGEGRKLIFGITGHDMLGWTHHVMDAAEETENFSDNFVLYYDVLASYGQSTKVDCKVFDPDAEGFSVDSGMSNTAVTSRTGLGYGNKDTATIKTQIKENVIARAVGVMDGTLSTASPVKWVWVGANGTPEAPEAWTTASNWMGLDAEGNITATQLASGDYPYMNGGANPYLPVEITGTDGTPIYINAGSSIDGWNLNLKLSHATVTMKSLAKIQGTTSIILENASTLTVPNVSGSGKQWIIGGMNVGDDCLFKVSADISEIKSYTWSSLNLNTSGRIELAGWTPSNSVSVTCTLALTAEGADKVVRKRVLGTWTGATNNLEFDTVTVTGEGVGSEDNTLTTASDPTDLNIGTYHYVKDTKNKKYVVYYVDRGTRVHTITRTMTDTVSFSDKTADTIKVNSDLLADTVTTEIDGLHKASGQEGTYNVASGSITSPSSDPVYFTPNTNVGNGGRWTTTFTAAEDFTLTSLALKAHTCSAGGGDQINERIARFTVAFETATNVEPTWTCQEAFYGQQTIGAGADKDYTFSGTEVTLKAGDTITITCDDNNEETNGVFIALKSINLTACRQGTTWSELAGNATDVTLTVEGTPTLTMDAAADIMTLTVSAEVALTALTFAGEQSLTVDTTAINVDTDLSGITADLGAVTVGEGAKLSIGETTTWTSLAGVAEVKSGGTVTLPETIQTEATIEVAGTVVINDPAWAEKIVGTGTVMVVVPTDNQGADYPVAFPETFTGTVTFVDEEDNPLTGYLPDGRYFSGSVSAEVTSSVTFSGASTTKTTVTGLLAGTMDSATVTTTGSFASGDIFQITGSAIVAGYSDKTTYFKPNVNVGNGNPWSATFTVTQDVKISKITLKAFAFNGDGATQYSDRTATFTCAFAEDTTSTWTTANVVFTGSVSTSAAATVNPTSIELTGEASKTLTAGQTITISCARVSTAGFFVGLVGIDLTVAQSGLTWSEVAGEATDVTLKATGAAGLTMDVAATVTSLTLNPAEDGAALAFDGASLTSDTTTINVNTDVSGITANLGAVTVDVGATLTIGAGTTMSSLTLNGTLRGTGMLPEALTFGENGILDTTLDTTAGTLTVPATMTWPETVRIRIAEMPTAATLILPGGTTLPATSAIYVGSTTEAAALTLVLMTDGLGVMPKSDVWLKVDGQWIDSLETAFTLAGTEKPITVAANKTLDALDLSNGECASDFNLAAITTDNLKEKQLAFEGTAVLTVGTLNLGWNRGFMGWAEDGETPLYTSDHLVVTGAVTMKEAPIEGSPVLMTWSWGGDAATAETPPVTMTTANGGTLTIGNGLIYTAPTADALGTLAFDTSLTGKGCWYEWLFGEVDADGNETTTTAVSSGRKTDEWNGTTKTYLDPAITVDGKTHQAISLSGSDTPHFGLDYTTSLEAPNWSASLFARMPSNAGGMLIAFGAANNQNKALILARGAEKNQMLLVYMSGARDTYAQVLADMPVPHGEDAYHLYSFVKYGADPDDPTTPRIEIFLDNELWHTEPGDYSVSTGLQMGRTYGGLATDNKYKVDGLVKNEDGTSSDLLLVQGTSGSIDMLRLYDCYLTAAEVARIAADGYTYDNDEVYTRNVSGEVFWNTANTWTKSGEESLAHAEPSEEAVVTLTATADTTITMNPSATVGEETVTERLLADLTLGKLNEEGLLEGDGTITFTTNSGSPHMKVEGITTVNTSAVVDCLALSLEGPVHVAAGKTLTLHLPTALMAEWAAGGTVVTKPLTGVLTLEGEGEIADTIAVTHGTIPDGYALTWGYNENTHLYEATLATWTEMWGTFEPTATTPITLTIAADATLDMTGVTSPVTMGTLTIKRADTVTEGMPTLTITNGTLTPSAIVLENTTLVLTGSEDPTAPTEYTQVISGSGAVQVASGYVKLSGVNTYAGGTHINAGATLTVTADSDDALGTITGGGTLVYPAGDATAAVPSDDSLSTTLPSGYPEWKNGLTAEAWTGTVVLENVIFTEAYSLEALGNANSTIELNGTCKGFFNYNRSNPLNATQAPKCESNVKLNGSFTLTRGHNDVKHGYIFAGKLMGEGTFTSNPTVNNSGYLVQFNDVSEFSGRFVGERNDSRIRIGDTTDTVANGTLLIADAANIASGKTWQANRGIVVSATGVLKGSGTLYAPGAGATTLTFMDGATIDATDGTLTVSATNDTVVYPDGVLKIRIPAGETNFCVLKTTVTDKPAQVEIYEGEATTPTETLTVKVNVAEGDAPAGLYVVPKPTIAPELPGITEETSTTVTDALVEEAINAGVTATIKEITVKSTNETVTDAGSRTVDAVEFFDGILEVEQEMVPDSETGIPAPSGHGIATVAYDFGIERMILRTLSIPNVYSDLTQEYVVLQVALEGGTFKNSTLLDLYQDGVRVEHDVFMLESDPTGEATGHPENTRRWMVMPFAALEGINGTAKFSVNAAGVTLWQNTDGTTSTSLPQTGLPNNADVSFLVTLDISDTEDRTLFKVSGGTAATNKSIELKIDGGALKLVVHGDGSSSVTKTLLSTVSEEMCKVAFTLEMNATGDLVSLKAQATGGTLATDMSNLWFRSGNFTTWSALDSDVVRLEVYNGTVWNEDTIADKVIFTMVSDDVTIADEVEYDPETMAGRDILIEEGATLSIPQTQTTVSTLSLSSETTPGGAIAVAEQAALIGEDTGEPGVPAYNLSPDVTVTLAAGSTLQMDGRLTSPVVIAGEGVTLGAETPDGVLILDAVDFGKYSVTVTQGTVEVYNATNLPDGELPEGLTIWSTMTQE